MKKRTRICNSFGEKLNVGMRNCKYGRTPLRSSPGCGGNFTAWFPGAGLVLARAAAFPFACGEADGCGLDVASALICRVCSGVFSPLNDGSCKNFNNHA